jgi:hypothetical protein
MRFLAIFTCVSMLVLVTLFEADVQAGAKKMKFTGEWKGSVADETLQKGAPECITSATSLAKLWKAWKIEAKMPVIDFAKEIVVLTTSGGSQLNLTASLDDKGDLQLLGFGTRDLRPGFRYVLATVSREGVKTVNKKELPKE